MSTPSSVVAQADARGQFLNASEIDALAAMVSDSNKRLDAVNRITSNASSIVADAARQLFAQQPALIALGGNAYTSRRMAACCAIWRSSCVTSPTRSSPATLP